MELMDERVTTAASAVSQLTPSEAFAFCCLKCLKMQLTSYFAGNL